VKVTRTTLRLPPKSVQYGYVEVDVEHDGNWEELGQYYYGVVKAFQAGEAIAKSGPKPTAPSVETVLDPAELIKAELGATDITDVLGEDVEEEVPEWEQPPPPPADDDWDF